MQLCGQAGGFTPEDENDVWRFTERNVPEQSLRPRRKEVGYAEVRKLVLERAPAWPHSRLDVFPVIETGSPHLTSIERKAKRFDEVQTGSRGEACASCVSGVPVNFGMHEYDMRCQFSNRLSKPLLRSILENRTAKPQRD
jgi:hypothetical protein